MTNRRPDALLPHTSRAGCSTLTELSSFYPETGFFQNSVMNLSIRRNIGIKNTIKQKKIIYRYTEAFDQIFSVIPFF
jgi:hypothetical protein